MIAVLWLFLEKFTQKYLGVQVIGVSNNNKYLWKVNIHSIYLCICSTNHPFIHLCSNWWSQWNKIIIDESIFNGIWVFFILLSLLQLFFCWNYFHSFKAFKIAVIINYFIIYLVFMLHGKILCTLSISEEKIIAYIRNLKQNYQNDILRLRIKIF